MRYIVLFEVYGLFRFLFIYLFGLENKREVLFAEKYSRSVFADFFYVYMYYY